MVRMVKSQLLCGNAENKNGRIKEVRRREERERKCPLAILKTFHPRVYKDGEVFVFDLLFLHRAHAKEGSWKVKE